MLHIKGGMSTGQSDVRLLFLLAGTTCGGHQQLAIRACNEGYPKIPEVFTITEKARTRAFSWFKATTSQHKVTYYRYKDKVLFPSADNKAWVQYFHSRDNKWAEMCNGCND